MGNSSSTDELYGNTPLSPHATPVVAVDARFCHHQTSTSIHIKDNKDTCRKPIKDASTDKVLLQTGNDSARLTTLLMLRTSRS